MRGASRKSLMSYMIPLSCVDKWRTGPRQTDTRGGSFMDEEEEEEEVVMVVVVVVNVE